MEKGLIGRLHEDLEGLEIEPVQVKGTRDPAIGIVHGAHGHEPGDQEVEVRAATRLDAPAEAETEGHEINDGDDHGREEIAELEELPLEEKHLLEVYGIPFRELRHSSRSPVSLMKTSSRFDLLMVTPFSMRPAAAELGARVAPPSAKPDRSAGAPASPSSKKDEKASERCVPFAECRSRPVACRFLGLRPLLRICWIRSALNVYELDHVLTHPRFRAGPGCKSAIRLPFARTPTLSQRISASSM